ncbi:MAG: hypothetical protein JETT_1368 [Candidatus Jettenia ecosi]|uniref:Uncharacterized protein n=1 Tax=Candidatus Jettenia ecosi TaxID=2494326 RepID=A0A533QC77_9BACT|nr:MAG: hypothetical protein JETT_1368 [Candidatus Jettenia ecosi]
MILIQNNLLYISITLHHGLDKENERFYGIQDTVTDFIDYGSYTRIIPGLCPPLPYYIM